ncbi:MAG: suppressor of fused domain protein [Myxococcales bacterium]|nr:suppressor of fused domain protein [Myxococcales bacterium]
MDVARYPDVPEPGHVTYGSLGLSNVEWPDGRPRIEVLLACVHDSAGMPQLVANTAFHIIDQQFYPTPGSVVRDLVGVLRLGDLSLRFPHMFFTVPRRWGLRLPLDEGPRDHDHLGRADQRARVPLLEGRRRRSAAPPRRRGHRRLRPRRGRLGPRRDGVTRTIGAVRFAPAVAIAASDGVTRTIGAFPVRRRRRDRRQLRRHAHDRRVQVRARRRDRRRRLGRGQIDHAVERRAVADLHRPQRRVRGVARQRRDDVVGQRAARLGREALARHRRARRRVDVVGHVDRRGRHGSPAGARARPLTEVEVVDDLVVVPGLGQLGVVARRAHARHRALRHQRAIHQRRHRGQGEAPRHDLRVAGDRVRDVVARHVDPDRLPQVVVAGHPGTTVTMFFWPSTGPFSPSRNST